MKNSIDFANWLINIQRIKSCEFMLLDELDDMYQLYNEYIEKELHIPYYL